MSILDIGFSIFHLSFFIEVGDPISNRVSTNNGK